MKALIEVGRDRCLPKCIQIAAARVFEARTHLKAIGLHQVKRAQRTVKAAQDHEVVLGPLQILFPQGGGLQSLVHIPVEGQHRLPGIFLREGWFPGAVALGVERRQRRAQRHQPGDFIGGLFAQHLDQLGGLFGEQRLRVQRSRQGGVIIEPLGGRKQKKHGQDPMNKAAANPDFRAAAWMSCKFTGMPAALKSAGWGFC